MKRFIVLASLAAFMVALPAAHVMAAPKKAQKKATFCVTGKNQSSGHVIAIPAAVAKRLQANGIGSTRFKQKAGTNECVPVKCPKKGCGGK